MKIQISKWTITISNHVISAPSHDFRRCDDLYMQYKSSSASSRNKITLPTEETHHQICHPILRLNEVWLMKQRKPWWVKSSRVPMQMNWLAVMSDRENKEFLKSLSLETLMLGRLACLSDFVKGNFQKNQKQLLEWISARKMSTLEGKLCRWNY